LESLKRVAVNQILGQGGRIQISILDGDLALTVPHKPPSLDPQLPLRHELPNTRPVVFKLELQQPSIRLEDLPGLQDGWLLLLEGKVQLHLSLIIEDDLALEIAPEVLEWVEDLVHGKMTIKGCPSVCGRRPMSLDTLWSLRQSCEEKFVRYCLSMRIVCILSSGSRRSGWTRGSYWSCSSKTL
jgi:hypothetical protein